MRSVIPSRESHHKPRLISKIDKLAPRPHRRTIAIPALPLLELLRRRPMVRLAELIFIVNIRAPAQKRANLGEIATADAQGVRHVASDRICRPEVMASA